MSTLTTAHSLALTGTNDPAYQVSVDPWNNDHVVFGGGATGGLVMRNTGDSTGASLLDAVAVGSVLASQGVGVAPAWSSSPTISGGLTVGAGAGDVALRLNADATHDPRVTFQIAGVDKAKAFYDHTNAVLTFGSGTPLSGLMVKPTTGTIGIGVAPTSGVALNIASLAGGVWGIVVTGQSTTGSSYGIDIDAGTNSSDYGLRVRNQSGSATYFSVRGDGTVDFSGGTAMSVFNGVQVGSPTGGDLGTGWINVQNGIAKNNGAYNNPDYALELWATKQIVKFAQNHGAAGYRRLSLDEIEAYARKHFRLPHIDRRPHNGEVFERTDINLEMFEELWTHAFDFNRRLLALEGSR